jgi:large subunit ribosomal protein L21
MIARREARGIRRESVMTARYAIVVAGASQHQVSEGEKLKIDLIAGKQKGDKLTFDRVLMVGGEGGIKIGQPMLAGAKVEVTVIDNGEGGEGKKGVKIWPLKRRPGDYVKHQGHRVRNTVVRIDKIHA